MRFTQKIIIKLCSVLFVLTLGFLSACGEQTPNSNNTSQKASDLPLENYKHGVLVKYKSFVTYQDQQSLLKQSGLIPVAEYSFVPGLVYARTKETSDTATLLNELANNEAIAYMEPNYEISTSTSTSTNATPLAQSTPQTHATPNNNQNNSLARANHENSDTLIAVVDTGIDISHNDLSNNLWVNINEIPLNNLDDDNNGWVDDIYGWNFADDHNNILDDNNHGTHVAGIISGNFGDNKNPANNNIKLVTLKVFDKNGHGTISSVIGALNYIVKNNIPLSNHSWSFDVDSLALKDALQQLSAQDHLLIVAAGNGSTNIDVSPSYPASYGLSNLLSVSALDSDGKLASFSNYGENSVQLSAYGTAISSTAMDNNYITLSGTSMASAFVSGIAVRTLDKNPQFTVQETKNWLLSNALQDDALKNLTRNSAKFGQLDEMLRLIDPGLVRSGSNNPINDKDADPVDDQPQSSQLTLSPATAIVAFESSFQLSIENGNPPYTWTIENPGLITIDELGLLQSIGVGSTKIWVSDANKQLSNEITITISQLHIEPTDLKQLSILQRHSISAVGGIAPYIWSISNDSIASITVNPQNNANIEILPLKTGIVSITVTDAQGNTSRVENIEIIIPPLSANPSALRLNLGQGIQLNVTGGSSPYSYLSENENIATVDLGGYINAVSEGNSNVTVTDAEGQVVVVPISVNPNFSISATQSILAVDETLSIVPAGNVGALSWSSSDSSIISVDTNGLVTAIKPGTASIVALDSTGVTGNLILEVRQVTLSAPSSNILADGSTTQLTASGGAAPYVWSIDNTDIASINTNGLITGNLPGSATVTVVDANNFSAITVITIEPAPLSVNQSNLVIAVGESTQLLATGGETPYEWISADTNIVNVDSEGLVNALSLGSTELTLNDSNNQTLSISVQVQEIGLIVDSTDILITDPDLLIVTSGGTPPYSWSVNNPTIASIDDTGLLSPLSLGEVSVFVTDSNNLSASLDFSIDVTPLSISPSHIIIPPNHSLPFIAGGGNSDFTWKSDNSDILIINDVGLAHSIATGTTTITLTDGVGQTIKATVEIRELTVSLNSSTIAVGDADVDILVSGGEAPYSWQSSAPSIARVSNDGKLTPVSKGNVTINVTDTDGISTSINVTVSEAVLTVNENSLLLSLVDTFNLVANGGNGNYTWSSANNSIVAVNDDGLVTALMPGTSNITLSDGLGQTINVYVEVRAVVINANNTNLTMGQSVAALIAIGGAEPYTWSSDNSSILDIDSDGNLSINAVGETTITATDQDGFSASLPFIIHDALSVNQNNATLAIGSEINVTATGGTGDYSWASEDPEIARVNSTGLVTALTAGSTIITVADANGQSTSTLIDVSSFNVSTEKTTLLVTETPIQINASGGAEPYSWQISDVTIAEISESGTLTPISPGSVTVTVTDANNNIGVMEITIDVEVLTINTTTVLLEPGDNFQLISNGGDNNYSWVSQDTDIARVNETGEITANAPGITTINLTDGVGQLVIINLEVRQLNINTSNTELNIGETTILTAVGGAAPYDWFSSDNSIAIVSETGMVSAITTGNVTISTTDADGFTSNINITVAVPEITLNKTNLLLGVDKFVQLIASNGSGEFTWSSGDTDIATVNENGWVYGKEAGTVTITVTDSLGGQKSANVEIREVKLNAPYTYLREENQMQISVNGGNSPYTWESNRPWIASVNSSGRVTARSEGTVRITATDEDGFAGSINLTIFKKSDNDGDSEKD